MYVGLVKAAPILDSRGKFRRYNHMYVCLIDSYSCTRREFPQAYIPDLPACTPADCSTATSPEPHDRANVGMIAEGYRQRTGFEGGGYAVTKEQYRIGAAFAHAHNLLLATPHARY